MVCCGCCVFTTEHLPSFSKFSSAAGIVFPYCSSSTAWEAKELLLCLHHTCTYVFIFYADACLCVLMLLLLCSPRWDGMEWDGWLRMGWALSWGCPQFPPLQLCLFIPYSSRCSFLLGTPTMFIDMLSQPDFDSYDLSTLRGGKSQNSNGKILRTRVVLVPCWEAVFLVL